MTKTIQINKKTINAMAGEYQRGASLAEIADRYSMSRGTVRRALADHGVRIRSKTEFHSFKTGGAVAVANLPTPTPTAVSSTLLGDLLKAGHISQAEINSLATTSAAPTTTPTTNNGVSFDGMTPAEKERAGLREVMRIVKATSKIGSTITQQQFADLWKRSGSWACAHQFK